jgi:hypothetical protein
MFDAHLHTGVGFYADEGLLSQSQKIERPGETALDDDLPERTESGPVRPSVPASIRLPRPKKPTPAR